MVSKRSYLHSPYQRGTSCNSREPYILGNRLEEAAEQPKNRGNRYASHDGTGEVRECRSQIPRR